MKKLYYSFILVSVMVLTGCNDWLDVNPRSQIKSEVLFDTESGYQQALNGVYIKLGQSEMYGKNASMYLPEVLARMWVEPTKNENLTLYSLTNFDYTESGAESLISNLFSSYYNAIAQLNDILENLQGSSVSFTHNNDKLIEGEALGLRAFLHLDALRLWGPMPDGVSAGEPAIPYVTQVTNDVTLLRSKTWGEVVTSIEQDLTNAEQLLENYDPVTYADMDSLNSLTHAQYNMGKGTMPKDSWQMLRKGRFNYYAVLATRARLYHWIGNKAEAVNYARRIVEPRKFELCTEVTVAKSLTMYPEHIFGVENVNLLDIVKSSFDATGASFTQKKSVVEQAYESTIHSGDIRNAGTRYWKEKNYPNGTTVNVFQKYIGNDNVDSDKRIPLIRIAEMYLILSEDLSLAEGKTYFSLYRITRGLDSSIEESSFASEESRLARLEKEYRKEFYGEGQMFAFYKKHNYTNYTWPKKVTLPKNAFLIPKPKGMTNFE